MDGLYLLITGDVKMYNAHEQTSSAIMWCDKRKGTKRDRATLPHREFRVAQISNVTSKCTALHLLHCNLKVRNRCVQSNILH